VSTTVYRSGGQICLDDTTDRRVRVRVANFGEPARVFDTNTHTRWLSWYTRGAVCLADRPELVLHHSGPRIGTTIALVESALGLDAICDLDRSEQGDALLDLVDAGWPVAVSGTFRGRCVKYPPSEVGGVRTSRGMRYRSGSLAEIAVVQRGAFASARIIGRSNWPQP
jgi:hypothetical protein